MKARSRALTIAGLALGLLLGSVPVSEAAHHLVKIRQVFPGEPGDDPGSNQEFVVLQLTSAGENVFGDNVFVRLYAPNGTQGAVAQSVGSTTGINANQSAVLVATEAVDDPPYDLAPDMTIPGNGDVLRPGAGAVCVTSDSFGALDCVGWGSLTGFTAPSPVGTLEPAIPDSQMLERSIAANCPTMHEFADDTNDSANDFAPAAPAPRSSSSVIPESLCPSLFVSRLGSGTGSVAGTGIACPPDCFQQYASGTPVTLTATATPPSLFTGFSANCTPFGTDQCTITPSGSQTVTATFGLTGGPDPPATTPTKKKCKKGQKLVKGKCRKKRKKKK